MSTNAKSLQSKKQKNALIDNLKLRWKLWSRKNATPSGLKHNLVRLLMYVLLLGLAFVFIFPFLYMLKTSVMSNADLISSSVNWIPTTIKFENFGVALNIMKPTRYLINSTIITVLPTIGHILACSFIGYGFARYNFPFKKVLFGLVILAFIVPVQTLIIPLYITYSNFGWLNTYLPLIVPAFFGFGLKGALYVFLFRQFYLTVPRSLEEAARIDGCGFLMTYIRIVFPLAKATIVVAMVLSVVWHWNDGYEPNLYINNVALGFLPPKLNSIIAAANALPEEQAEMLRSFGLDEGEDTLNNAVVMAGAAFISAPIIIFFGFAQRLFMQGIERTGITGE